MKYRTIVADPPWPYEEKGVLPLQAQYGRTSFLPYPSMSIEAIEQLSVRDLAQSDVAGNRPDKSVPRDGSLLFLWATTRHLESAHSIVRTWGLRADIGTRLV